MNNLCRNKNNQFIVNAFEEEIKKALNTRRKNIIFTLRKVIKSIKKYPMPIISKPQISMINGEKPNRLIKRRWKCDCNENPEDGRQKVQEVQNIECFIKGRS